MNILFKMQEILGTSDRIYWTYEIYSFAKYKVTFFLFFIFSVNRQKLWLFIHTYHKSFWLQGRREKVIP